jgi:hypothetical protein
MMIAYPSMRITRREWSLGLVALAGCGRKKATAFPGYALVSTSGENSLAVVDLSVFRLIKQIDLGSPPTAVVVTSGRSFVLTPSSGSVHILDADLRRVSSHRLADGLSGIRLSADGKLLLAISSDPAEFIIANARTLDIIRRQKLDAAPVSLDVASSTYAAISTRASIHLFQLETGGNWRAQMPGQMGTVRFRADGQLLLAANPGDSSLTALNVPALQVVTDLPLAMKPENLCFNADAGQLFVSGDGMDAIAIVFPYNTLEVEQTILAGRDPGVMACSADPAYLFVASHSGSDVCILGIDNRTMIGIVEVGVRPSYITVTPDSQYALVLDELSGDMAVIRVTGIRTDAEANRTKSGAALFTMIPVGARPVHAAIVPKPLG